MRSPNGSRVIDHGGISDGRGIHDFMEYHSYSELNASKDREASSLSGNVGDRMA